MRRFGLRSTIGRLLTLSATVSLVVVTAVVIQVVKVFDQRYLNLSASGLASELSDFQASIQARQPGAVLFNSVENYLRFHRVLPGQVVIVALKGRPILGTEDSKALFQAAQSRKLILSKVSATEILQVSEGDTPYLVLAAPLREGGRSMGTYFGFEDLANFEVQRQQVLLLTILEGTVILVFALLSAYFLLRRVMGTVGEVTDTALQIAGGDLDQRLPPARTDDELGELTETFNLMISRLQGILASERQLLADVSHQLRTPLTVLRGNVELIESGAATTPEDLAETIPILLDEIEYMSSLVDRLLYLERLAIPRYLDVEPIDLRSFIYDLYSASKVLGDREWRIGDVSDLTLMVDQGSLRGAVLNMIDNALKATCVGEVVELSAIKEESFVCISVRDEGRGVPKESLSRVFSRFETSGSLGSRGAGLGLAIVRATAQAHGGEAWISSQEGEGTTVTIGLPVKAIVDPIRDTLTARSSRMRRSLES